MPQPDACPHGDRFCPCPDGDPCHYEGENPMPCPTPGHCKPDAVSRFMDALSMDWGPDPLQPYQQAMLHRLFGMEVEVVQDPTDADAVLVFDRRALEPKFGPPRFVSLSAPDPADWLRTRRPLWVNPAPVTYTPPYLSLALLDVGGGYGSLNERFERLHMNRYWADFLP